MIKDEMYEGYAYYFYEYSGIAEFGYFKVFRYSWSNTSFKCKTQFLFGYSSNINTTEGFISSNQLHGQNIVKHKFENWYIDINDLKHNGKIIIKTIFEAKQCII